MGNGQILDIMPVLFDQIQLQVNKLSHMSEYMIFVNKNAKVSEFLNKRLGKPHHFVEYSIMIFEGINY